MKTLTQSLILLTLLTFGLGAQVYNFDNNKAGQKFPNPQGVLQEIESGINKGDASLFTKYLSENSYINLPNGVSGYFSSNQSFYILKDFFKTFVPVSFSFTETGNSRNPVATGRLKFDQNGKRDSATVYIALSFEGNSWRITQLSVN
ncbi:MAG: DUF4783 domain-containing protein [Ignavibacteria bacterium]|nr:DUF4783 domain-containing protein [Ignavibacteria bacterium]MCA0389902.1 DUF4783 domain-containing protein [Bacteroidota bacterium]